MLMDFACVQGILGHTEFLQLVEQEEGVEVNVGRVRMKINLRRVRNLGVVDH